jgi:hypothetical protein
MRPNRLLLERRLFAGEQLIDSLKDVQEHYENSLFGNEEHLVLLT